MELTLGQALQKGIEAHRAGNAHEADKYYTAILKANPKHPHANHNMGVLAVGLGKLETALPFFRAALDSNPSIDQFWLSFIDALIKLDKFIEAEEALERAKIQGVTGNGFEKLEHKIQGRLPLKKMKKNNDQVSEPTPEQQRYIFNLHGQGKTKLALKEAHLLLDEFPRSQSLHNAIASFYRSLKRPEKALETYKKLIEINPNFAEAYSNMGNTLTDLGKFREATESYNRSIALKPDYAEAYINLGKVFMEQGKLEQAIQAYDKALLLKPGIAEIYNNMGIILRNQGKLTEAIEAYKKGITLKPDFSEAYNNMGNALQEQGKLEEAMVSFNRAISITPNSVAPWCNGADTLEKWNKLNELTSWLERAESVFYEIPPDLILIKSKLLWRNCKYDESFSCISRISIESVSEIRKKSFVELKAKFFEKTSEFDEAYRMYSQLNSLAKKSKDYLMSEPDKYFEATKQQLAKIKSKPFKKITSQYKKVTTLNPVFLVGFPRSGTTLLDTILRSHSGINVVEEQPNLRKVSKFIRTEGFRNPLDQILPTGLLEEARKKYELEVKRHIDKNRTDKLFIDKLPLNLLQAPVIHQLYPDAKFILALRHPMDCILSCWMQNFKLNEAMANMVDLERIAEFYCIAMETFKICRTNYNLNVHEIRYEDLINNFKKETEAVLEFLELPWEPAVENYQKTAFERGKINTPSYSQVVQPIYKDAKYRWLNYEKHLRQYYGQVKPWISEFGYG